MARAYVGIGSNLGDRAEHVAMARAELARLPETRLTAFSSVHETDPVGPAGQGRYLNAAAVLETRLDPFEFLNRLRAIERKAGRERHVRWAARTLDLDLLLYEDRIVDTPELRVPHPRMHERRFVLEPLAEIAPDAIHLPSGKSVRALLSELDG